MDTTTILETRLEQLETKFENLQEQYNELQEKYNDLQEKYINLESKRNENYYQRFLERKFSATHKRTKYGITDITTDTQHIEIKHWKDYKSALGQLLSYNHNDDKILYVYFFGKVKDEQRTNIIELYRNKGVNICEFEDTPNGIEIKKLLDLKSDDPVLEFIKTTCNLNKQNKGLRIFTNVLWDAFQNWEYENKQNSNIKQLDFYKKIDKIVNYDRNKKVRIDGKNSVGWYGIELKKNFDNKNSFWTWLDKNVEYSRNEEDYVELKNVCEMYLKKQNIHSKISAKYKMEIEKWIEKTYPNISSCYKRLTISINNIRPRGWNHLKFKSI